MDKDPWDSFVSKKDREIILDGEWLNDKIIHAAQLLMKNNGESHRYSSVLLVMRAFRSFAVEHLTGSQLAQLVQIILPLRYDSLYKSLPWSTKEQIAALLHTNEKAITLAYANVQVRCSDI